MILINKTTNTIISENVIVANSFFKRLKGLMFTKDLSYESAMHIIPCNEIHTFFMNYSIDVLYLDRNNTIVAMDEDLKPRKVGKFIKNAKSVVEIPSGKIRNLNLKIGQSLEFIE